jgi:hypothetical protein
MRFYQRRNMDILVHQNKLLNSLVQLLGLSPKGVDKEFPIITALTPLSSSFPIGAQQVNLAHGAQRSERLSGSCLVRFPTKFD